MILCTSDFGLGNVKLKFDELKDDRDISISWTKVYTTVTFDHLTLLE